MNKVIVVTGQTSTGKTAYGLALAKKINGELINADSRQVYKKLDIITGKDLPKEAKYTIYETKNDYDIGYYVIDGIKIWLLDVVDPKYHFSSYDYKTLANYVIDNIINRGKKPIIVGGTYLYIKHLLYGVETETIPPDWQLRKKLRGKKLTDIQNALKYINKTLYNSLNKSDKNNPRRLIRKIEISQKREVKHKTNSKLVVEKFVGFKFKNKDNLIKHIKNRVEERMQQGALDEIKSLLAMGYARADPGLQTIGCRQTMALLEKKVSIKETIDNWIIAETQYAKRQYTFMKKNPRITWIDC